MRGRVYVEMVRSRWTLDQGSLANLRCYRSEDREQLRNTKQRAERSEAKLRLKLVTTAEDESAQAEPASSGTHNGTKVLKELVMPWARAGRIVAADSGFNSVEGAEELYKAGLRYIGVVKTATRRYPMSALQIEFCSSGGRVGLLSLIEA
jgi:Transposase IS4